VYEPGHDKSDHMGMSHHQMPGWKLNLMNVELSGYFFFGIVCKEKIIVKIYGILYIPWNIFSPSLYFMVDLIGFKSLSI
jgi:hypothetical protein